MLAGTGGADMLVNDKLKCFERKETTNVFNLMGNLLYCGNCVLPRGLCLNKMGTTLSAFS